MITLLWIYTAVGLAAGLDHLFFWGRHGGARRTVPGALFVALAWAPLLLWLFLRLPVRRRLERLGWVR